MKNLLRAAWALNHKIVLCGVIAVALVYALSSPTISEPIMDFCFGGIVPGTNHVLDPEVVISGATVAIGLIVVFVLVAWLRRIQAVRRVSNNVVIAAQPTTTVDLRLPVEDTRVAQKKTKRSVSITEVIKVPVWLNRLVGKQSTHAVDYAWMQVLQMQIARVLRMLGALLGSTYRLLRGGIVTSVHIIRVAVVAFMSGLIIVSKKIASNIRTNSIRFWRWLRPRAARFDTWLELKYRAFAATYKKKAAGHEPMQVIAVMIREGSNTLRQLFK
jgi:hypothetical protein